MMWENDIFKINEELLKLPEEEIKRRSDMLLVEMRKDMKAKKAKTPPRQPCAIQFAI